MVYASIVLKINSLFSKRVEFNFMRKLATEIKSLTDQKHVEKLDRLSMLMVKLIEDEFTGHIKINFSQGGIGRVEKFEEILKV